MEKLKIKISETAYHKIMTLLVEHKEYPYLRLSYKAGCGKSAKIEVSLDDIHEGDYLDTVDTLEIIYDDDLISHIKEVSIIYQNASFKVKTLPQEDAPSGCGESCSTKAEQAGCSGCSGSNSGCGGCKGASES